ncbi:MAG TPA: chemotaxis protein CheB [Candidatus Xenobia bacterium]|jgi:two-component system chemotaxis response regulator CheB
MSAFPQVVVVVGASAGGVEALSTFCRGLPADLQAAVCIVLHVAPTSPSLLPSILQRFTSLPVSAVTHEEPVQAGHVYVASPDRHLMLLDGTVRAVRGPRENRHRPAIDTLFRSAAHAFGSRVIGVVLSGMGDDGTAGLATIKAAGGKTVVQQPDDAYFKDMPVNALRHVQVDHRATSYEAGALVGHLAREQGAVSSMKAVAPASSSDPKVSGFTCPFCHGAVWESEQNGALQFECRVGHTYSPESLRQDQGDGVEAALWAALRALDESAALDRRLETYYPGEPGVRYRESAGDKEAQAVILRRLLLEPPFGRPGDSGT